MIKENLPKHNILNRIPPKEKAKELIKKMDIIHYRKIYSSPESKGLPISMYDDQVKGCALIAINEILGIKQHLEDYDYWKEVKSEVEKLQLTV